MVVAGVPLSATFRRAEGLKIHVDLCGARFQATASRQGGTTQTPLSREEVRLISRLARWRTAAELGVPQQTLASLVQRNCLFWSRGRPDRVLVGEPLLKLEGRLALRENLSVVCMLRREDKASLIPEMPRASQLDGVLGGVAFSSAEMEHEIGSVYFFCCAKHAALMRDLVPRLDGSVPVDELADGPELRGILETMNDLALLEPFTPTWAWDGSSRVTWLSHAGVMIETAGKRILVDPVAHIRSTPTRFTERPFDLRQLGHVDAVLITHGDHDHLHPPMLTRLPRSTPIVLPSNPTPEPFQVDLRRLVELLGFENIIEVEEWQTLRFGEVEVVATPFRGEDWGLTLPCRTFLVRSPDLTVFLNADSTSTPEAYERIARDYDVDLAFVGVTGAAESHAMPPGYGYGDFYTQWIPKERHNEWVELCNGPRAAAEAAVAVGARYAFGYAAGGAEFNGVAYTDRGTHDAMANELTTRGDATRPIALKVCEPTVIPPRRS